MEYYTIGEIFRLGLLKSRTGEPYNNKGTVSKALKGQKFKLKKTMWGMSKTFSRETIDKLNRG